MASSVLGIGRKAEKMRENHREKYEKKAKILKKEEKKEERMNAKIKKLDLTIHALRR